MHETSREVDFKGTWANLRSIFKSSNYLHPSQSSLFYALLGKIHTYAAKFRLRRVHKRQKITRGAICDPHERVKKSWHPSLSLSYCDFIHVHILVTTYMYAQSMGLTLRYGPASSNEVGLLTFSGTQRAVSTIVVRCASGRTRKDGTRESLTSYNRNNKCISTTASRKRGEGLHTN